MARNTLARHRNLFSRDPDEGGGGGTGGSDQGGGSNTDTGSNGGGGSNTGGKTFTQADVDQIVATRLARQKAQFSDYDELKAGKEEADRIRKEAETANEKAVREAREQAATEERRKLAPQAVKAEFRASAKGVLTDAQRDAFLEDADLTKYLKDNGEVDIEKVEAKVKALAPEKSEQETTNTTTRTRAPRDTGAGQREGGAKPTVSSSREDYLERRKKALGIPA